MGTFCLVSHPFSLLAFGTAVRIGMKNSVIRDRLGSHHHITHDVDVPYPKWILCIIILLFKFLWNYFLTNFQLFCLVHCIIVKRVKVLLSIALPLTIHKVRRWRYDKMRRFFLLINNVVCEGKWLRIRQSIYTGRQSISDRFCLSGILGEVVA